MFCYVVVIMKMHPLPTVMTIVDGRPSFDLNEKRIFLHCPLTAPLLLIDSQH